MYKAELVITDIKLPFAQFILKKRNYLDGIFDAIKIYNFNKIMKSRYNLLRNGSIVALSMYFTGVIGLLFSPAGSYAIYISALIAISIAYSYLFYLNEFHLAQMFRQMLNSSKFRATEKRTRIDFSPTSLAIIGVLKLQGPNGYTYSEIGRLVGLERESAFSILEKMIKTDLVKKRKNGVYSFNKIKFRISLRKKLSGRRAKYRYEVDKNLTKARQEKLNFLFDILCYDAYQYYTVRKT